MHRQVTLAMSNRPYNLPRHTCSHLLDARRFASRLLAAFPPLMRPRHSCSALAVAYAALGACQNWSWNRKKGMTDSHAGVDPGPMSCSPLPRWRTHSRTIGRRRLRDSSPSRPLWKDRSRPGLPSTSHSALVLQPHNTTVSSHNRMSSPGSAEEGPKPMRTTSAPACQTLESCAVFNRASSPDRI